MIETEWWKENAQARHKFIDIWYKYPEYLKNAKRDADLLDEKKQRMRDYQKAYRDAHKILARIKKEGVHDSM